MASEYLMKKYKDVKPDEPKVMTEKEKRRNWWYYHRMPLLITAVVLVFVGSFVHELVSKVDPDFQIAYSGEYELPGDLEAQIEARLSELVEDVNGDGKTVVEVVSYVFIPDDVNSYAVEVSLMGDLAVGTSEFFLVEDPEAFQEKYGLLAMEDGVVYDYEMSAEPTIRYAWEDLPVLCDLETGRSLYLTRRIYTQEDQQQEHANMDLLWSIMTEGIK